MKRGREDHGDGRHSQLDEETLRYYEEVGAHFKTLDDDEEKQILADNVLSETEGKEADVVPDAACSRVIESFIPYASITAIDKFTRGCLQDDNLGLICTRQAHIATYILPKKTFKVVDGRLIFISLSFFTKV